MPSYVYVCTDCRVTNEIAHSITIEPEVICPRCEQRMTRKPQGYALSIKHF